MANERTLLAYGRTALGLVALAAIIFKFMDIVSAMILGSIALTGALFIMFWGIHSYRSVASRIDQSYSSDTQMSLDPIEID